MRKRKLYLSEFIKRNKNADTCGILYDRNDNEFKFNSFKELEELEHQMQESYEIEEWTYTEYAGYIILIK